MQIKRCATHARAVRGPSLSVDRWKGQRHLPNSTNSLRRLASDPIHDIVAHLAGENPAAQKMKGIYSIRSAHAWVLGTAMKQALHDGTLEWGRYSRKPAEPLRAGTILASSSGCDRGVSDKQLELNFNVGTGVQIGYPRPALVDQSKPTRSNLIGAIYRHAPSRNNHGLQVKYLL